MNRVWLFIELSTRGRVKRTEIYGSLRKMHESEEIYVDGYLLPELALRKVMIECENNYKSNKYIIRQVDIVRKKQSV